MSAPCQIWQVTKGSLIDNDQELSIRFVDRFGRLAEARAFLSSDAFMRTYIQGQGLSVGQFFIIPEGQLFVILPGRLQTSISIGELHGGPAPESTPA